MHVPATVEIGAFEVHSYSIIMMVAIIVAIVVCLIRAEPSQIPLVKILRLAPPVVFWMLIIGRLFFVLNPPPSTVEFYDREWFLRSFADLQAGALAFWAGGLDSGGMLLGGVLGVGLALRKTKTSLQSIFPVIVPGILFGVSVGVLANLPNQDLLGGPTAAPWGVIARGMPYDTFPDGTLFHPTPIYLSLMILVVSIAFLVIERRRRQDRFRLSMLTLGTFLGVLVAAEFFILDITRVWPGVTPLQVVAVACSGLLWWLWQHTT